MNLQISGQFTVKPPVFKEKGDQKQKPGILVRDAKIKTHQAKVSQNENRFQFSRITPTWPVSRFPATWHRPGPFCTADFPVRQRPL